MCLCQGKWVSCWQHNTEPLPLSTFSWSNSFRWDVSCLHFSFFSIVEELIQSFCLFFLPFVHLYSSLLHVFGLEVLWTGKVSLSFVYLVCWQILYFHFFMIAIFIYFVLRCLHSRSICCKTLWWCWIPATVAYPVNYLFSFHFCKIALLSVVFWCSVLFLSGVWICLFILSWSVRLCWFL